MSDLMKQYPASYVGCNLDIPKSNCTLDTCCLAQSYFLYRPTHPGNSFFAAFFAVLIIPQIWLCVKYKTWGFGAGMILGLLLEAVGYLARVGLHIDPFSNGSFLMQARVSDRSYDCASLHHGCNLSLPQSHNCRLWRTPFLFQTTDDSNCIHVFGLSLAGTPSRQMLIINLRSPVGGAWAESKTQSGENNQGGVDVMIAGLLLQAISLATFVGLWAWFQLRVLRGVPTHDPAKVYTRQRTFFYAFNAGLLMATAAIVVRSIYRVAELWGGFSGKLWNDEVDFMILDGAMIGLAVCLLTVLHPGAAFGGQWHMANWNLRKRSKQRLGSEANYQQEREMKILWNETSHR
ncbi:hypothetical protein AC578_10691 [Pseudocercospora eumusae]|uniref:RTA1 domain protein n=1 Tax=Pseudocercospora eumusae TaxID=321146 RepID=A0A139HJL2_9PEZI|nr:hypothetical protein AC578_10691 [Pseudocercospora eumusae]